MSKPPDDDDDDDDENENGVVVRPRTPWEWFRRGDKRLALAGMGAFVGAGLASVLLSGGLGVAYNTAPSGIRHLFWIGGAGFVFGSYFMPGKFRNWRRPLGTVWMDGWRDYAFIAGAVAVSCASCAVIGRLT